MVYFFFFFNCDFLVIFILTFIIDNFMSIIFLHSNPNITFLVNIIIPDYYIIIYNYYDICETTVILNHHYSQLARIQFYNNIIVLYSMDLYLSIKSVHKIYLIIYI